MSTESNDILMEWARELMEELTNHPSGADRWLEQCIKNNNLEELRRACVQYGADLAREDMYNNDLVPHTSSGFGEIY